MRSDLGEVGESEAELVKFSEGLLLLVVLLALLVLFEFSGAASAGFFVIVRELLIGFLSNGIEF
jgi:hypothetical protein